MTNFEKCKSEFLIKDIGNGSFCKAIHRIRNENKCSDRTCENCVEWLKQEYKEPILDRVEKQYLANIIRPFRDKVDGIIKFECNTKEKEYIKITLENESGIDLPFFAKGSMYKGMETNREYRLKELGL